MICPVTLSRSVIWDARSTQTPEELVKTFDCLCEKCAWWDEKKKQCCIKTLAQKENFNVRVAR